jgi:hypothetical protein
VTTGRELDVRVLQHRLQAVDDPRPVLHQGRTVAGELPELPLRFGWNETAPQEAVAQQFGDPFGILHVRLAPRHRFDVLRIDHQEGEQALQEVIDGAPIDASAFHRHVRTAGRLQPVRQQQQLRRHRPERPDLFLRRLPLGTADQTRDYGFFMDIESTAAGIDDVHGAPP